MESRKYACLNDRDWLVREYLDNGRSTLDIARSIGAPTGNSVRQALARFSIPIRNRSKAQTHKRSDGFRLNLEVLHGCLLGDGGLKKSNPRSQLSMPYFYKKNKNYDHVEFVANQLFDCNVSDRIVDDTNIINGKSFTYHKLSSFANENLDALYKDWYPAGKKVVPNNVCVTTTTLLHWFLDDGSSSHRRKESKTKQITITMSSQSFTKTEQEMLCSLFNESFELGMSLKKTNSGTGYVIGISQSKSQHFFDVIGKCPVDSMIYKWK
jgi:hypothetical protein